MAASRASQQTEELARHGYKTPGDRHGRMLRAPFPSKRRVTDRARQKQKQPPGPQVRRHHHGPLSSLWPPQRAMDNVMEKFPQTAKRIYLYDY